MTSLNSLVKLTACLCLQNSEDFIDLPTLTAYVSYARKNIHPKLSDEAAEELTRGYVEMRQRGNFAGSSKKVPWLVIFLCTLMISI